MQAEKVIFIVGAARSGTTMTRTVLSHHPDLCVLPYEMNYLWRYGNDTCEHDFLTQDMLSPKITRYIQNSFKTVLKKSGKDRLVDKTVANICRMDYIKSVFPHAQFIHIIRSPLDAIYSAYLRWQKPVQSSYLLKKGLTIPWRSVPYYGFKYLSGKLATVFTHQKKVHSWGPVFPDMEKMTNTLTLSEICALQWKHCVEAGLSAAKKMDTNSYLQINYELFVENPTQTAKNIFTFLSLPAPDTLETFLSRYVDPSRRGKAHKNFTDDEIDRILPHIESTHDKIKR